VTKIKKNDKGVSCSTYWAKEGCIQGFGVEVCGEKAHLDDPGARGRTTLKCIFEKLDGRA